MNNFFFYFYFLCSDCSCCPRYAASSAWSHHLYFEEDLATEIER